MTLVRGAAAHGCCATIALAIALAACAPSSLERAAPGQALLAPRASFEVTGRLTVRYGANALAANFRWRHEGDRDEVDLASPLGQTLAQLVGDADGVRLTSADGRVDTADDWTALTQRSLGWPLPVGGLAFWIQGAARERAPFAVEPDVGGHPSVLRQDGWTIVYHGFATASHDAVRPTRMTLSYSDVELRLAIDAWR